MKSKGSFAVQTTAVVLNGPRDIGLDTLTVAAPQAKDLVVQIKHSGISTGTEKLFWSGQMPPFPGMGYPLVPGYEATGEVVEAPQSSAFKAGDTVFVPGALTAMMALSGFLAAPHVIWSAMKIALQNWMGLWAPKGLYWP